MKKVIISTLVLMIAMVVSVFAQGTTSISPVTASYKSRYIAIRSDFGKLYPEVLQGIDQQSETPNDPDVRFSILAGVSTQLIGLLSELRTTLANQDNMELRTFMDRLSTLKLMHGRYIYSDGSVSNADRQSFTESMSKVIGELDMMVGVR